MIPSIIKDFLKKAVAAFGYEVLRAEKNPKQTLLGLKALPIGSVIDVGANQGQFAQYITKFFPKAHLFCFEPLPKPFRELQAWADRHKQVIAFNLALGDHAGTVDMYYHLDFSPGSSFLTTTEMAESVYPFINRKAIVPVTMSTLDQTLSMMAKDMPREILIKLDVQGYEDRVIRGGQEVFTKAKAAILEVNVDSLYDQQADFKDLLLMLSALNYRYVGNIEQNYGAEGHVIYFDAVFIK
jgi:FkbM family methyltransferase